MDLATLLGLVVGWASVGAGAILKGGKPEYYVSVPAFLLVFGGTVGATMVSYSLKQMLDLPRVTLHAFLHRPVDIPGTMNRLIRFADRARREGLLSLEGELQDRDDPFLAKGVRLVVDGTDSAVVREILDTEIELMEERHRVGESIYTTMAGFSPTLGIIGTVISLINMMQQLDDPSKLGHMLAAAFIATLYGVALANLMFLPLANKLRARSQEEVLLRQVVVEGVLAIQAGENPRVIEEKLRAFLPPALRSKVSREAAAGAGGAGAAAGAPAVSTR
ncbi:MAG: flagellar motor protein [Armatimonadota bacterium]|nr:flagellar motor protein [Armatimonadota bacterium]MDR7429741.1 flagellar motor protein [Armatimonadota bacterium]MDR7432463.1 flagellar motor protein [Armatimonadota bacterium]MDR7447148.1 flagellar motor protein [Armatimonadota bacterium]MDR7477660.1 flagellar motor protein [Armatimonadota bacterium]